MLTFVNVRELLGKSLRTFTTFFRNIQFVLLVRNECDFIAVVASFFDSQIEHFKRAKLRRH